MWMMQVILEKKIALTGDVFELHYKLSEIKTMLPGQFITFILPDIWGRAYSILEMQDDIIILIIKKWEEVDGGRWGSIALCDASVWDEFKAVWPAGNFVLQDNDKNKLFLGTGTGLVPLYSQILAWLQKNNSTKYHLVFWVRYTSDMFYCENFKLLENQYPDRFSYTLYTSRDQANLITRKWYVTDFLSAEIVSNYSEYYICGAPWMIEWCQKKLADLSVNENAIYFEKY